MLVLPAPRTLHLFFPLLVPGSRFDCQSTWLFPSIYHAML
jgi:hypothetical protein